MVLIQSTVDYGFFGVIVRVFECFGAKMISCLLKCIGDREGASGLLSKVLIWLGALVINVRRHEF